MTPGAEEILASVRKSWASADGTADSLRGGLEATAVQHGLKLGKAQAPVRVAVTGTVGLPLFESVEVLGREHTLTRIDAATAKLAAPGPNMAVGIDNKTWSAMIRNMRETTPAVSACTGHLAPDQ